LYLTEIDYDYNEIALIVVKILCFFKKT
jgi:hypothetical protein